MLCGACAQHSLSVSLLEFKLLLLCYLGHRHVKLHVLIVVKLIVLLYIRICGDSCATDKSQLNK